MFQGKKLNKIMSDKRVIRAAVIVGFIAIILLWLSSAVNFSPGRDTVTAEAYAQKTEQRLHEIVTRIEGVGEADIFLTMDNSGESFYLKNSDTKTLSKEPVVRGVVIVCDGGDDPVTAARVMDAVTKALDVPSNKVCVTK